MPNETQQDLHIVGPRAEIDRFIRIGFTHRGPRQFDDLLHFTRLCPLKRGEPKTTSTHDSGVVLIHFRTRTQAMFSMISSWDYPVAFYERLAQHWPTLAFAVSVNGEMNDFGGILLVRNGTTANLVRDYDADYIRRTHTRQIARALRTWFAFLTEGRQQFRLKAETTGLADGRPDGLRNISSPSARRPFANSATRPVAKVLSFGVLLMCRFLGIHAATTMLRSRSRERRTRSRRHGGAPGLGAENRADRLREAH